MWPYTTIKIVFPSIAYNVANKYTVVVGKKVIIIKYKYSQIFIVVIAVWLLISTAKIVLKTPSSEIRKWFIL